MGRKPIWKIAMRQRNIMLPDSVWEILDTMEPGVAGSAVARGMILDYMEARKLIPADMLYKFMESDHASVK